VILVALFDIWGPELSTRLSVAPYSFVLLSRPFTNYITYLKFSPVTRCPSDIWYCFTYCCTLISQCFSLCFIVFRKATYIPLKVILFLKPFTTVQTNLIPKNVISLSCEVGNPFSIHTSKSSNLPWRFINLWAICSSSLLFPFPPTGQKNFTEDKKFPLL